MDKINNACENGQEEEAHLAQMDIWKYAFGFSEIAVVKCAIELGIADFLETRQEPVTLDDLSSSLGCSPSALYRIMRFLTNRGIFKQVVCSSSTIRSNSYAQTPLSRLLVRTEEKSMAALVLLESSPVMLEPWQRLRSRVLLNSSGGASTTAAFEAAHGDDVWHYAERNPAHSKLINDAMACDARMAFSAVVRDGCTDEVFGKGIISSVVDVGGGDGTAIGEIIKACPWIRRGINFDLPHVVSVAPRRCGVDHVGGSFFKSVPKADAAFVMWVLHDWGDDECIEILKKCKEAIPDDHGKVIIVEAVLDEDKEGKLGKDNKLKDVGLMLDMVMMAHTTTGKERTAKEWGFVLSQAGFTRHTVKHIQAVQSIIEAYP